MERRGPIQKPESHYVIGISGASGAAYGCKLIETVLQNESRHVHLIITAAGQRVIGDELKRKPGNRANSSDRTDDGAGRFAQSYLNLSASAQSRLHGYACNDIGAAPAGGTFKTEAMIVCPCSMNTLASIAHGLESNLLTRAAAVTLKEGRPLILVPREMPLGLIELRNMVTVTEAGGSILPASPGFYHHPETIDEIVSFVVQKIMDRLGLEMDGAIRWQGDRRKSARS
jgi:4-hydroxy-3-polyprenylbenzoate decarboxylase